MANEFNIKNGFITSGNSNVYANLNVTGTLSASTISASTVSSPFTTGSVIFQGSGGTLTQNNSQLFWDNTNNRLGVGTASPTGAITAVGAYTASTAAPLVVQNTLAYGPPSYSQYTQIWLNSVGSVIASMRSNSEFSVSSTISTAYFRSGTAGNSTTPIYGNNAASGMYFPATNIIGFSTTNVEALRIFSGQNISIGTTTDSGFKLDVNGTTRVIGSKGSVITDGSSTTAFLTFSGSNTIGGTGYTDFIRVTNTATGATNPNKTFRTNNTGALEIVNSTYGTVILSLTDAGVLVTTGGGTSDSRKKQNIQYIDDETTPHILNLKPVKFEYKDYSGTTRHGFIAQDVLETYPELVLGDGEKENGTYGLDYDGILSLTVKSLQETILKVEKLEKELNELKNKLG